MATKTISSSGTERAERRRKAQARHNLGSLKSSVAGMKPAGKKDAAKSPSSFPARPDKVAPNKSSKPNGMAGPTKTEVKKVAKKAVSAAKKTVKAAAKTVRKAASLKGKSLGEKNTYTTSGTHAGGRRSSASRKIKQATSLKRAARG